MSRPPKHDVEYFPFYAKEGKTLYILESNYQCKGTGFFINVLRFLAGRSDHHFCIEKDVDKIWFFSKTKCDEESGIAMLEMMVTTGKLDKQLWEEKRVIASNDFLESIKDAYKKRTNDCVSLCDIKSIYGIDDNGNGVSGGRNGVSGGNNTQSKVKESKVKKSINIYDTYLKKIQPERKSKQRALTNIQSHLKKFSEDELLACISNYFPSCKNSEPQFRKDPANFFGKNEPYFKDFLPDNFDNQTPEIYGPRCIDCQKPLKGSHYNGRCEDCNNIFMGNI